MTASIGWTSRQIDDEPLARVLGLLNHWRDYPPTNELMAAKMGIKPRVRIKSETQETEDRWWETVEEEYANQDLGGFLGVGAPIKVEE